MEENIILQEFAKKLKEYQEKMKAEKAAKEKKQSEALSKIIESLKALQSQGNIEK